MAEPPALALVGDLVPKRQAVEVAPDKQGRILVPAALQAAADLSGAVLLIGNLDRVELWAPATYGEVVKEQAGEFQQFAHTLFG